MPPEAVARIDASLSQIVKILEAEPQFRDWVHKKIDEIKGAIFGNGKKGLIRDMDQVQLELKAVVQDFTEFKAEVRGMVRSVAAWGLTSCIGAICLIVFEVAMFILRKGP